MTDVRVPLLWLCGPPGVGKSTVGWQLFSDITQAGITAGFVDIDQVGMCYPEPTSKATRHDMMARNLGALVSTFQAAGARCVVVSGVIAADDGIRTYADRIPQATITVCWLHADRAVLRERLVRRGMSPREAEKHVHAGAALDHSAVTDLRIDTSGLPQEAVTRLVRERIGDWPASLLNRHVATSVSGAEPVVSAAHGPVLWLCGATGVGKSTVGWKVFERVRRAGVTAAFVDLDQIGFLRPVPTRDLDFHRVKARNLAAMWQNFHATGARCLIVNGPVHRYDAVRLYTDALPAASFALVRLHASATHLRERIVLRRHGGSWPAPGDPLKGRSIDVLHRLADAAIAEAAALERAVFGDVRVDTDGRAADELAEEILDRVTLPWATTAKP